MTRREQRNLMVGVGLTAAMAIGCGSDEGGGPATPLAADDAVDGSPVVNGCHQASYVDRAGTPTIHFGGDLDDSYSPACITVSMDQQVSWSGDFEEHPLSPGVAPSVRGTSNPGTTPNPIPTQKSGTTTITATFGATGYFPYYCIDHEDDGMYGTVQVVP